MTAFLSIAELGAGYREGRFTPLQVVEEALDRARRLDPGLNAFAHLADPRAEALQATRDLAQGRDLGPLHGIPVAVKDLIEVAGMPTGYGSKVHAPRMATADAPLVARLRAAGAIILGKTNLLEYAYGIAHPEVGQTNNPHDLTRTAGGSSGGSAAAVAAGIVPLAIGTDTGGSIRIPAAYCGIVGVKPTYGLVPLEGVFPCPGAWITRGPLARNLEDAALGLACLSGQPMGLAEPGALRIGMIGRHVSRTPVGSAVTAHVEARLGAKVTLVDAEGLAEANANLVTILAPEAALIHAPLLALNPGGYAPGTLAQIRAGAQVPATDYIAARRFQAALRDRVEALFETVDVLVSPAVPFVAPHEDPVIVDGEDSEMLASGFANVTGHPSLSLPFGMIDGLPVGLQVTGPFGQDRRLLSMCRALIAAS